MEVTSMFAATALGTVAIGAAMYYAAKLRAIEKVELTEDAKRAMAELEAARRTKVKWEDTDHEKKLETLWSLLLPNTKRDGRTSSEWGDIGFQGHDPCTDFRGMGLLGLESLLYLSQHKSIEASSLIRDDSNVFSYPFAVAGINLTSETLKLLEAVPMLANALFGSGDPALLVFGELMSETWVEFDRFNREFTQEFLLNGGIPELCVMQFTVSLKQYANNLHESWKGKTRTYEQATQAVENILRQVQEAEEEERSA